MRWSGRYALALAMLGACAALEPGGDRDQADNPAASAPCIDAIEDKSGRALSPETIAGFDDPVAARILRAGDDCPTTWAETLAKLERTDADEDCADGLGVRTSLISERSQLLAVADQYRSVSVRACNGRASWELMLAPPTSTSFQTKKVSDDVEVIAFRRDDKASNAAGEYQFYALESSASGRRWRYYGSSSDMLLGPGKTPSGGRPFVDQDRRCAHCHLSGSPIMKELERPWNGWDVAPTSKRTPRYLDMVERIGKQLSITNGPYFAEEVMNQVKAGTRAWNRHRIAELRKAGELEPLLRPLFCTTDVNLGAGSQFLGSAPDVIPTSFLVDPWFEQTSNVRIPQAEYAAGLARAGQVMKSADASGQLADMKRNGVILRDTLFAMVYPERSFRDIDYVDQLIEQKVVSAGFATAVLMVDFTRPVYSDDRCGLLALARGVKVAGSDQPKGIQDAFIARLADSAAPGADELAGSLRTLRDAAMPEAQIVTELVAPISRLYDRCAERAAAHPGELVDDLLRLASHRRRQTRPKDATNPDGGRAGLVIEHGETLPFDSLPPSSDAIRLDPSSCELTSAR